MYSPELWAKTLKLIDKTGTSAVDRAAKLLSIQKMHPEQPGVCVRDIAEPQRLKFMGFDYYQSLPHCLFSGNKEVIGAWMLCNLMDSVRQRTDKTFVNAQYQNSAVVILRSVGTFQMGIMNKPSKQNTMSGAVMVSYRSKKFIRKSVATDISLSSGKLVFDPDLHKSTLRVQTKEAIRDASSLDNESIEELNGALKNEKIISIS